jgi:hypothetical protein
MLIVLPVMNDNPFNESTTHYGCVLSMLLLHNYAPCQAPSNKIVENALCMI